METIFMKKLIIVSIVTMMAINVHSQETEKRENNLFELFNNFSTAYLFNTYALIGSIADGYDKNAYDENTVTDLLNAQKKLATDLVVLIENKLKGEVFTIERRKKYLESFIPILNEFNLQIDLFFKVLKNNSRKNVDAYVEQRKKSWKDISNLVGLKD